MNVSLSIDLKPLEKHLIALGTDAPRAAGQALFLEGERIMAASKPEVPVDMSVLRNSGHVQPPKIEGDRVSVTLGYGGAAAGYALYVHEGVGPAVGRAPFFPPPAAFEGWARRHGIPTDKSTLFLLARAIGRRGLRPTKYLERPMRAAVQGMSGRIAAHLRKWIERRAAG